MESEISKIKFFILISYIKWDIPPVESEICKAAGISSCSDTLPILIAVLEFLDFTL